MKARSEGDLIHHGRGMRLRQPGTAPPRGDIRVLRLPGPQQHVVGRAALPAGQHVEGEVGVPADLQALPRRRQLLDREAQVADMGHLDGLGLPLHGASDGEGGRQHVLQVVVAAVPVPVQVMGPRPAAEGPVALVCGEHGLRWHCTWAAAISTTVYTITTNTHPTDDANHHTTTTPQRDKTNTPTHSHHHHTTARHDSHQRTTPHLALHVQCAHSS